MIPYLLPILLLCFGIIKYDINGDYKGKKLLWFFIFLYFTLLIGLRYRVGGDTINYMSDYEWRVSIQDWEYNPLDKFQPGYSFLCAIGKSLSPQFYIFQLIHAFILNLALAVWIWKNTKYVYTSFLAFFLIGYLYFSTEVLREALAVVIFLFNYKNLVKSKWISYYIGVLLSCLFHLSAVILIILPFFRRITFNRSYILLILLSILVSALSAKFLQALSDQMVLAEKAQGYAGVSTGMLAGLYKLLTTALFPILYGYLATHNQRRKIKFEWLIGIMGLLGVMTVFNTILFGRFNNYFVIFFCVSFADTIIIWYRKKGIATRHNALILSLCFILVYGIGFKMYNKYTLWIPYYSIYNPHDVKREFAEKMLFGNK